MNDGVVGVEDGAAGKRFSTRDQISLSLYWFSLNFHWGALLTVVVPTQVLQFVPDAEKGKYLGLVFFLGAFVAVLVQPVVGAISDRSTFALGRRRPYVLVGTVLNALALLLMAYTKSFAVFTLSFLLVQFFNNVAGGAYQGLIPDLVPEDQRGAASGYMGLMTMLGTILSLLLAGQMLGAGQTVPFYWLIVAVMLLGMSVTLFGVRERPISEAPPFSWRQFLASFWISPRAYPDFAWLFVTRAMVMLGFYTLLNFLEYYLKDVAALQDFVQATTTVGAMVMIGATLSTLICGWLSDRIGRRIIVFLSGLLMGSTALIFLATNSYPLILAFSVVFGLGYGAYTSVDWALAVDVLPSARSAGKDLGVWSISVTLPQVVAPLIGGQILYRLQSVSLHLSYQALYAVTFIYFLLGSVGVWKIKGAR